MQTWKAARGVILSGASLLAILFAGQASAQMAGGASENVLDAIVVTGSSIRGVPPVGSNLIGVTRDDIKTVGATTTPDLLAVVPQLNSFNTAPRANNAGAGSFAPGLRSLPATATLPLMNGHRLVAGGANETNPDFPFLPDLAIERVEIVADGASSIYGSDAIAGVVNFITRKRYSGLEMSARYGTADDYHTFSVSGLAGRDWGGGGILGAYQYSENGNVTGADRGYRKVDFRPFGGVDARGTSCAAPNVVVAGVVYGAPGLAPNSTNYCDVGAPVDLVPASRLHSGFLSARQEVGQRVTLWGEVLYSDRKDHVQAAIPAQTVVLTAANPFFKAPPGTNATVETVLFRPDNIVGANHFDQIYHVKAGNSSAGADVSLPGDFKLNAYGTYDWAEHVAYQPMINPVALAAAAAGTTSVTALDPFGAGTSASVANAITDYSTTVTIKQSTKLAAMKIDGPLMDLPGGELKIAAGAEYRHETFRQRGFVGATQVPENLGRNIKSIYGELFVPIVGDANAMRLARRLSVSLSGRYDKYSDFGSTSNPKVGVNWDPVEGLTLRGTYGRSFRAPGLRDVGATVGAYYYDAATAGVLARDPTRGTAQVNTVFLLGGNKSLQPEKARTYSFGVDVAPKALPGFRASATFYDINFTDVIGTPPTALVFTDPTFSSVVYRNPSASQLASLLALGVPVTLPTPLPAIGNALDLRRGNFGVRKTNGVDFDVSYRRATSFGSVFGGVAGNYILKFNTQLSPTAPVSDALKLGVPKTTVRTTTGLTAGSVTGVAFVNYRDGVTNNYATPTGTSAYNADAYTTVDLRVSTTLPNAGLTKGAELALQVNDLFDKTPPFAPATDGIGGTYNPIGRFIAVNLRKTF